MNYTPPQAVTSPQDYVKIIQVIHDGGNDGYSVAKIEWDEEPCLAIRWNIAAREWDDPAKQSGQKVCVGMPSSRGYPVWFVLPDEILNKDSEVRKKIDSAWPGNANISEQ